MTFHKELRSKLDNLYKKVLIWQRKKNIEQNTYFKCSTTKRTMNSSCSLSFTEETEKKKKEINEYTKTIVKKYINNPDKLMQYIKMNGASVYRIKDAEKILAKIGEEEGFITPLKGVKALALNLILSVISKEKPSFCLSTKELFVFDVKNMEIYTIARAFYKYQGYKHCLPGYDYKSQETFKKMYKKKNTPAPFNNCSINDMYACKEAISRDLESINFTIELSVEYENAKKALDKIKETNSANV